MIFSLHYSANKMSTAVFFCLAIIPLLSGCVGGDPLRNVKPMYVPSAEFENMNCTDLFGYAYNAEQEIQRIREFLPSGGFAIYPPGGAAIAQARQPGKGEQAEAKRHAARLMGEIAAVENVIAQKNCAPELDVQFDQDYAQ